MPARIWDAPSMLDHREASGLERRAIAVVLKGYPRLSETFIAQELRELERAGFRLRFFSMRHPTETAVHPIHREIAAPVRYLPEYLHNEPLRVFRAWLSARRLPGYRRALRQFLRDLPRDLSRNRVRRFGQALVLAAEMPDDVDWIYSHFIHTPGSVSRYAHILTALPWSCSAHAKDIWTSPEWELADKLSSAEWTVTCTGFGQAHLNQIAPDPAKVHLIYHGLDLSRFPHFERRASIRDGSDPDDPVRMVTVGRAVAKKGLDTMVDALARLPAGLNWRWIHIGGGELSGTLAEHVRRSGLAGRVELLGAQPQDVVLETYRSSDLFVLPSRVAPDGDRDGLPNVLVEAASQGLPCISTPVSGIVELISHGENGLLVEPDDADALADAIVALATDPEARDRLGSSGARRVSAEFDHRRTIGNLIRLFEDGRQARGKKVPEKTIEAA